MAGSRGSRATATRMGMAIITLTPMGMIIMTMSTAIPMAATITHMSTDAAKLMRLMSWLSPAFPIGAYSYSHALERAVETGAVRDHITLVDWLDADLRYGAGRTDGIFFAETWRAVTAPVHACEKMNSPWSEQHPLPPGEDGGEELMPLGKAKPQNVFASAREDSATISEASGPHLLASRGQGSVPPLMKARTTGCSPAHPNWRWSLPSRVSPSSPPSVKRGRTPRWNSRPRTFARPASRRCCL